MTSSTKSRQRLLLLCLLLAVTSAWAAQRWRNPFPPITESKSALQIETLVTGLEHPWALAELPGGGFLITERPGRLRRVLADGKLSAPLGGVPAVRAYGQGGMLDVILDSDFSRSRVIYLCYSEPREQGNGTAVARARLGEQTLEDFRVIFQQQPAIESAAHFGCRMVIDAKGYLFVTLGERGSESEQAQQLDNHLGKVVRLNRDGSIPPDNPYAGHAGKEGAIWSYGHRNPQGAALHPVTGQLWIHEHGPQGGDELNRVLPGLNYGWPQVSHGVNYGGDPVGAGEKEAAGIEPPRYAWVPSIATSGMAFYNSERHPGWRGDLLLGSLKYGLLVRLEMEGERVTHQWAYDIGARVRDVRVAADGQVYLLTDESNGRLLRVSPKK